MAQLILHLAAQAGQMFLVLLLAPLLTGVTRKIKARLQRRRGAGLLQPYTDLWKLLRKEVVPAENASRFYRIAPYVIFATIWVAAALVPTFASGLLFNWTADLIVIVGLLATARFTLALAAMDVGTSFGGMGAAREMMIAVFAEPAMLMVVFTVSMLAHSTQLSAIAQYLILQPVGLRISLALALVTFSIVLLAENARIPVDNPASHLELTMVHEAMLLEYSGRHLAMIDFAASIKLLLYMSIFICLFLPFGMATGTPDKLAMAAGTLLYLGKLGAGGVLLGIGESAVAKMRIFRLSEFVGMGFVLGLLAVLLLFVTRGVRG
jgi:formate hydrogenlyase subunit 4